MADEKHLQIMRQGAATWDEWRRNNPKIVPNVAGADLRDADLHSMNLDGVNFGTADLTNANLSGVSLRGADLGCARLINTNFEQANLREARVDSSVFEGLTLSDRRDYTNEWCRYRGPILNNETMRFANFVGANLEHAYFYYANLEKANLHHTNLYMAIFKWANLHEANLQSAWLPVTDFFGAHLNRANLVGAYCERSLMNCAQLELASLRSASFHYADFTKANLKGAKLNRTKLNHAILREADFSGADLTGADLSNSVMSDANVENSTLAECSVYGVSAWNLKGAPRTQHDLIITQGNEPAITVDNLEVAQFVYLLLHNEKLRGVIDTVSSKVVLILGRFTPSRKEILDAIKVALRSRGYLPVLFDFDPPKSRDMTETVAILAHLASFVIADITDAKSIPHELKHIVPELPSVPIQPIILETDREYGMFEHFRRFPWVLNVHLYRDKDELLTTLNETIIPTLENIRRQFRPST